MMSEEKLVNDRAPRLVEPFSGEVATRVPKLRRPLKSERSSCQPPRVNVAEILQNETPVLRLERSSCKPQLPYKLQPRAFADRLGADPLMPAGQRVQAMQPLRSSPPARAGGQTLNTVIELTLLSAAHRRTHTLAEHHLQPMEHTIVIPVPGVEDQDHRHAAH